MSRVARTVILARPLLWSIAILAWIWPLRGGQLTSSIEDELLRSAGRIRLGDSASHVGQKLEPLWVPVLSNRFLPQQPFKSWVPYTNILAVSEWHSQHDTGHGWPAIVFVVFSNDAKTNLVDALLYSGAPGVFPLVDGQYDQRLRALKPGDSMQKVFTLLGKKDCDYFLGQDGKWHVKLIYVKSNGEFVQIEADAASGTITHLANATL